MHETQAIYTLSKLRSPNRFNQRQMVGDTDGFIYVSNICFIVPIALSARILLEA